MPLLFRSADGAARIRQCRVPPSIFLALLVSRQSLLSFWNFRSFYRLLVSPASRCLCRPPKPTVPPLPPS